MLENLRRAVKRAIVPILLITGCLFLLIAFSINGQPKINEASQSKTSNNTPPLVELPVDYEMLSKRYELFSQLLNRYPVNNSKCIFQRIVGVGDWQAGGQSAYRMCMDKEYCPVPGKCLVYSFGINNEWSFDDGMARMGCKVFAFDPSMFKPAHRRGQSIQFYPVGIANFDGIYTARFLRDNKPAEEQWPVKTLASILKALNHEHSVIDILKMDVEEGEFASLEAALSNKILQNHVRSILVEWHFNDKTNDANLAKVKQSFQRLHDAGFEAFFRETRFQAPGEWFYISESLINTNLRRQ